MSKHNDNGFQEPRDFKPVKIVEIDLSQPLPDISSADEHSKIVYGQALIMVRLHGIPLGLTKVEFHSNRISQKQLAAVTWKIFGRQINQHLVQDGLPAVDILPGYGLASQVEPKCQIDREIMLQKAPLISIIIATRDRTQSLAATMVSILALEYPQFEVILVDNAPKTSDTYDYFTGNQPSFLRKEIYLRYVREDVPGLAVAHNRGLEAAHGSYVAFTDDDVVVDKHWLSGLLQGFTETDGVGCVTGLVIPLELQTPAQVLFEEFGGFTKGFTRRIYGLSTHRPDDPLFPYTAGRFGTGANMAFKTDSLLRMGGFDPALGIGTPVLGADDMAAFFQTLRIGQKLVYQPSAIVYHQHRRSYEALQRQMFGYGTGLTAFLTKSVIDNPGLIFDIASKAGAGFRYAFAADSTKNQNKSGNYPRELEQIERKGMLVGPARYLVSLWYYRKVKNSFTNPKLDQIPSPIQHYLVTGWTEDYPRDI